MFMLADRPTILCYYLLPQCYSQVNYFNDRPTLDQYAPSHTHAHTQYNHTLTHTLTHTQYNHTLTIQSYSGTHTHTHIHTHKHTYNLAHKPWINARINMSHTPTHKHTQSDTHIHTHTHIPWINMRHHTHIHNSIN